METTTTAPLSGNKQQSKQAAAAAFFGSFIEWYDFYIFGTASALVLGKLFFPSDDPFLSTMAAFATFGVGFFVRPIGAVVFGHIGDRIGRKKTLMITLIIMGSATVCIGLLPDYQQAGVFAPICLVFLRILQGFTVGGEWGGAVLLAGEHAPKKRRVFFASFAQLGSPAGLLFSIIAFRLVSALSDKDLMSWGWRIPFLASFILMVIGAFIRHSVDETPEFKQMKDDEKKIKTSQVSARLPLVEVLRSSYYLIILCIGANMIGTAGFYFTNTFMISYTTQNLGITKEHILESLFFVTIIQFLIQPIAAICAEKFGVVRFLQITAAVCIFSPYFMFTMVKSGGTVLSMIIGIAPSVIFLASSYAAIAGYVTDLFPVKVRYTAISISYQLCGTVSGGVTPLLGTYLAREYAGSWFPLAIFFSVLAGISLLCVTLIAMHVKKQESRAVVV